MLMKTEPFDFDIVVTATFSKECVSEKLFGSQRVEIPSPTNPIQLMIILFQQDGALYIYFGLALIFWSGFDPLFSPRLQAQFD